MRKPCHSEEAKGRRWNLLWVERYTVYFAASLLFGWRLPRHFVPRNDRLFLLLP